MATNKKVAPKITPENFNEVVKAKKVNSIDDMVVDTPKETNSNSNQEVVSMNEAMKGQAEAIERYFKNSKRVRMVIPLGENEDKGSTEFVGINGYNFYILKGKMVEIPEEVATLIANKYDMEMEIAEKYSLDRNDNVRSALT